jgi:hypothetical protein
VSGRRDELGTALVELVWLSVLLLLPLVYVMVAVFDVQRASYGVSGAARAAARAYSLAPDEKSARGRAEAAASVALRDQGVEPSDVGLVVRCAPRPDNCLSPGSSISVDLSHQVVLPLAPDALGGGAPSVRVEASHTVSYGAFREDR